MLSYVLRRFAGLIPTLIIIVTASFLILRLAPGGPFDQEQTLSPAVRANLERAYGLDQPLLPLARRSPLSYRANPGNARQPA